MAFADDLTDVLGTLDAEGVTYMFVGAQALDALGVPRATADIDLQIKLDDPRSRGPSTSWVGSSTREAEIRSSTRRRSSSTWRVLQGPSSSS